MIWHLLGAGKTEERKPLAARAHGDVNWLSFTRNEKEPLLAVALAAPKKKGEAARGGEVIVLNARTGERAGKPITFSDSVPQKVWFAPNESKRVLVIAQANQPAAHGELSVCNVDTGTPEAGPLVRDLPVNWAAFSPDGALIVTAEGALGGSENGRSVVWLWQGKNGDNLASLPHDGGPLSYVEFDPDGNRVVTAEGADEATQGAARVWNIATRKDDRGLHVQAEALTAPLSHTGAVTRARFSPDGLWLASAGRDRMTCLWHIRTQKKVLSFEQGGDVNDVAFSPDGRYLASGRTRPNGAYLGNCDRSAGAGSVESHRDSERAGL